MSDLKKQIMKVMSSVFEVSVNDINENSSSDSIENWDSLKHLNLIIALEDEFDISIPNEEVANMVNFKLIELIVNECKK
jgi:acyl carrier protein